MPSLYVIVVFPENPWLNLFVQTESRYSGDLQKKETLRRWFSNLSGHQSSVGLLKTWIAQPYPSVSKSADPGWSLRICISSKLSVDAAADNPGTTL